MLTFLSKGLFSVVVALVRLSPLRAKERCIIRTPGFEERPRPTVLDGLPSWRTDGCGEEITLNKNSLKIRSQDTTKECGATLPPAMSGTSLCSANYKVAKKHGLWDYLSITS